MPSLATPRPLLRAIKKQVGKVKVSLRSQGEALEELFQLFTSERQHLKRFSYMNDPRLRLAYLRYHLPLNTVRSICVLKDLLKRYPTTAHVSAAMVLFVDVILLFKHILIILLSSRD